MNEKLTIIKKHKGFLKVVLKTYIKKYDDHKKGDNIVLAAFGGGFTWGAIYVKWAYDSH